MSIWGNRPYVAVILGHLCIDTFNSMGPVLLAFLSVPLGFSAAQIGLALAAYQLLSALTQPPFGWLADRVGSRWLGPGSVAWTVGFVALALYVAEDLRGFGPFLICFALAGVGSGAFHPQGTMQAATATAGRSATTTALFFLFGQAGLASGPALAGLLLDRVGSLGIYLLALSAAPVVVFMLHAMRGARRRSESPRISSKGEFRVGQVFWLPCAVLALVIALRTWAFLGTAFFLPTLFGRLGWNPTSYGLLAGAFWMASAVTGVMAGGAADRWGRRVVVTVSSLAGSLPLFFLPLLQDWRAFLLVIASGGLLGAGHSILVVMAQALLPVRRGLASGLTLGYIFAVGAGATFCIGILADHWGLVPVIQAGAGVGTLAALLALLLPSTRADPERRSRMATL